MNSPSFTDPDTWYGGFYELGIRLGTRDDARLQNALDACSCHPAISGWYRRHDLDPSEQERIPPTISDIENDHFFGFAAVPGLPQLVCGCLAIRYDPGDIDWFHLYIPIGVLSRVDKRVGAFPFGLAGGPVSLAWRSPLDAWFVELAQHIYGTVTFELGLIGLEVPDRRTPVDISVDVASVPETRDCAWLIPHDGALRYFPTTE